MANLPSQHYLFAHRFLPELLWQGDSLLGILVNPENQAFLGDQWDAVAQHWECAPSAGRERLSFASHWIGGDNLAVVIFMPPPEQLADAYFAAITTSPALRYFTLEIGQDQAGRPRTVLGEWTREGRHLNYGDGPAPDPALFLQAVCEKLGLPPTMESPTVGQRQGMSRRAVVYSGILMEPADLSALQEHEAEAEKLEEASRYGEAFERYHTALTGFLARYPEPPTEVTLLYWGAVRCLRAMGRTEAAETWARQWWTVARRFRALGHEEAMSASREVAEIVSERGRRNEAEAVYHHRVHLAGLARGLGSPQHERASKDLERFARG